MLFNNQLIFFSLHLFLLALRSHKRLVLTFWNQLNCSGWFLVNIGRFRRNTNQIGEVRSIWIPIFIIEFFLIVLLVWLTIGRRIIIVVVRVLRTYLLVFKRFFWLHKVLGHVVLVYIVVVWRFYLFKSAFVVEEQGWVCFTFVAPTVSIAYAWKVLG